MPISSYLFFKGDCREAMSRYAEILNLPEPDFFTAGAMPPEERANMPGIPDDAVMHCMITYENSILMASDDMSPEAVPMAGCSVNLTVPTPEEAQRVFDALAMGGEVRMPLMPVFWTKAFGTLTDRYGIRWMVMASMEP